MDMYKKTIQLQSHGERPSYFNITSEIQNAIKESGIQNGLCFVVSPHTTCSVFYEEYVHDTTPEGDDYLSADLNDVLEKIVPTHRTADQYRYPGPKHFQEVFSWPEEKIRSFLPHMKKSECYNADAHLRSTLIGNSVTLDVEDGKLVTGITGFVYFVDFDCTHPRNRNCKITVIGEKEE
jgi:thiamine phosphate synthase YjbQ (UPF0047 family)